MNRKKNITKEYLLYIITKFVKLIQYYSIIVYLSYCAFVPHRGLSFACHIVSVLFVYIGLRKFKKNKEKEE